jgi:hypothetical protein
MGVAKKMRDDKKYLATACFTLKNYRTTRSNFNQKILYANRQGHLLNRPHIARQTLVKKKILIH